MNASSIVGLTILMTSLSAIAQTRPVPTAQERAERERRLQEQLKAPRPIAAADTVWIDELTWMEVRDAIAAGKTTVIVSTGGIEQNGPYMVTGKHNYVLRGACEGIARKLRDALCAPVIKFVPEGDIEKKTGSMRFPGTISLRQQTFLMLLDDVSSSLKAHGFKDIVLIGDSGGNQRGLELTAATLNGRWTDARAHFIREYYNYDAVLAYMEEDLGIVQPADDGFHDNFYINTLVMLTDPTAVRYDQRVKAGKATINGLSIEPKEAAIEVGRKLMQFRVDRTVDAIRESLSSRR